MQFGFMGSRLTTYAVLLIRPLKELFAEKKKNLHHIFVDLEKAFDRVHREVIPWALRQQRVPENLVQLIMCLYTESKTRVRRPRGCSGYFETKIGVYQGSAHCYL